MRHTNKSVGYQLMHGDRQFVVNCLMILNSRKNGFTYHDYKMLKSISGKVKKRQRLDAWDWQLIRNRLNQYTDTLAFALNDMEKKKKKALSNEKNDD